MSPELVTGERAPDLDAIDYHIGLLERECRDLIEWARGRAAAEFARVQDAQVELEDEWTGRAALKLGRAAYELRSIKRRLIRAQLALVNPDDDRYAHVSRQLVKQDDSEHEDAPWKPAAAA